jgi:hypothetical protein
MTDFELPRRSYANPARGPTVVDFDTTCASMVLGVKKSMMR